MPIDASCFKFADNNSHFLRYSLDGVFYNTNNYANQHSDISHWNQISRTLGLNMLPWIAGGRGSQDHKAGLPQAAPGPLAQLKWIASFWRRG